MDNIKFKIAVNHKGKNILFECERIYSGDQVERYQVSSKGKSIIVQNNRPELRTKNNNAHKFKWKLFDGPVTTDMHFLKELFYTLEKWIEGIDEGGFKSRSYQNHPKNKPR